MANAATARPRDVGKWLLFAVLGALVLLSAYVDDRFVVDARDPEWGKLATWPPLIPHALGALAALLIGPLQFSDTLRARRPAMHRWLGRTYVAASLISAPLAGLIAWQHHPLPTAVPQVAEAVGWFVVTAMALINALARNFNAHKLWMMRSYGFCMVFVLARLPDIQPNFPWDGVPGVTVLWTSVVLALVVPDLILNTRDLLRRRGGQAG